MKTTKKLSFKMVCKSMFAMALCTVAVVFSSCSKDDNDTPPSQHDIETLLVGSWKLVSQNGYETPTNLRTIDTFFAGGKGFSLVFDPIHESSMTPWLYKLDMTYTVQGNELLMDSGAKFYTRVDEISENRLLLTFLKVVEGDNLYENNWPAKYVRVKADYSKDIVGLWEGVEMTGENTHGTAQARQEYHADGTYTYYIKQGDEWVPSSYDNQYSVQGDWLSTRWRQEPGDDYTYEWWDIDELKDGIMKWSALREKEDGTQFTTTFIWKKIQ